MAKYHTCMVFPVLFPFPYMLLANSKPENLGQKWILIVVCQMGRRGRQWKQFIQKIGGGGKVKYQAKTRKIMANEIINYQTSMFPLVWTLNYGNYIRMDKRSRRPENHLHTGFLYWWHKLMILYTQLENDLSIKHAPTNSLCENKAKENTARTI